MLWYPRKLNSRLACRSIDYAQHADTIALDGRCTTNAAIAAACFKQYELQTYSNVFRSQR